MGGLFSTTYDVQKVGQNVKTTTKRSVTSSVSHEVKIPETGNNVEVKSDIEIIGPISGSVKKQDAKSVRIDESKIEVFENVEAPQKPPQPPISVEEKKKQEDLMMAMVRGEIHPKDNSSELTVNSAAHFTAPEECEFTSKIQDVVVEAVTQEVQAEHTETEQLLELVAEKDTPPVEEAVDPIRVENITVEEETTEPEPIPVQEKPPVEEDTKCNEPTNVEEIKNSPLSNIQSVEEATRILKERILYFSGTTKNQEYEELEQAIVNNILKLDDLTCDTDESNVERKRVIKVLQQCMQNLERKIETPKHIESDSE